MANTHTPVPAFGSSFTVHRDHVGFVIGKKYAAINQVARDTHTRIQVNDQDKATPFVQFVIGGRSENDVSAAFARINELAARAEQATPRVAQFPTINHFNCFHMNAFECRITIHPDDVGMVLGAKASTLKKTQRDTWTWAKLFKATPTNLPFISVRGFLLTDVDEAIKRIASIAQEAYNRRTGAPRHNPQPKHNAPVNMASLVSLPNTVTFAPTSPTYTPTSPTYAPTSPHTPPSA